MYSPLSSRDSTRVVFIRTRIGLGETWFGWILHGGPSKYIHVISVGSWRTVSLLSLLYSRLPKNYPRVSKPRYTWTEIISLLENSMAGDLPMVSLAPSGLATLEEIRVVYRLMFVHRVQNHEMLMVLHSISIINSFSLRQASPMVFFYTPWKESVIILIVGSDSSMHVKILILIINLNSVLMGCVYLWLWKK